MSYIFINFERQMRLGYAIMQQLNPIRTMWVSYSTVNTYLGTATVTLVFVGFIGQPECICILECITLLDILERTEMT